MADDLRALRALHVIWCETVNFYFESLLSARLSFIAYGPQP